MSFYKEKEIELKTYVVQTARGNRLLVDLPVVRQRSVANRYAVSFESKTRGRIHPDPAKIRETEARAGALDLRNGSWNRTQVELDFGLALTSVFAQY